MFKVRFALFARRSKATDKSSHANSDQHPFCNNATVQGMNRTPRDLQEYIVTFLNLVDHARAQGTCSFLGARSISVLGRRTLLTTDLRHDRFLQHILDFEPDRFQLAIVWALKKQPKLKILVLDSSPVDGQVLNLVSQNTCPRLQEISLQFCTRVSRMYAPCI